MVKRSLAKVASAAERIRSSVSWELSPVGGYVPAVEKVLCPVSTGSPSGTGDPVVCDKDHIVGRRIAVDGGRESVDGSLRHTVGEQYLDHLHGAMRRRHSLVPRRTSEVRRRTGAMPRRFSEMRRQYGPGCPLSNEMRRLSGVVRPRFSLGWHRSTDMRHLLCISPEVKTPVGCRS